MGEDQCGCRRSSGRVSFCHAQARGPHHGYRHADREGPGDTVAPDEAVVILEPMKMEIPVEAEAGGRVKEICCQVGQSVSEGDSLVVVE